MAAQGKVCSKQGQPKGEAARRSPKRMEPGSRSSPGCGREGIPDCCRRPCAPEWSPSLVMEGCYVRPDPIFCVARHWWPKRPGWTGGSRHPPEPPFEPLWRIRWIGAPAAAAPGQRCHGGANLSCAKPMGLAHCPLCVGLAILSVVRCSACGVMLWQWLRPQVPGGERHGRTTLKLRPAL